MDRRQQKTRRAVFSAFEELIAKKRYEEITVQDIVDLADIGRTTFYAHFETKDSVLDALCADLFAHIFDENLSTEGTHDFSGADHSEAAMLTHILYHLKEDKTRYRRLFAGESAGLFWNRFENLFRMRLDQRAQSGQWKVRHDLPGDLYMQLYVSSFVETVKWWFQYSCRETPETVVSWFEDFCSAGTVPGHPVLHTESGASE